MFSLYILQSEIDKSYYIGHTKDRDQRLWEHNFGRTRYSSKKRPWKLVYFEEYPTKSEAATREKYLKSLKSRKYIENLIYSRVRSSMVEQ